MNAERIVELCKQLENDINGLRQLDNICYDRYGIMNEAVREIMSEVTTSKTNNCNWIPCSERLPENNQQCLIYRDIKVSNLKMTTGIYNSDRQVFIGLRHGTALRDAIAWMPLPKPPQIET